MIYFIFGLYFLNLFFGLKMIFKYNYNLSNITYSLLAIIILPLLTPLIYLMTFLDESIRRILLKKRDYDQMYMPEVNDSSILKNNEISVFNNGELLFDDVFKEILNAKHFIHISFFTFNSDKFGREFISKLEEKLKEGVEVIIMYDPIGSHTMKKKYFKNFKKLGGQLISYMPLFINGFFNLNYRNHRKIIVIDNKISYIGGFNVGDQYVNKNKKMGKWVDSHLKIVGQATTQIEKRFLVDYAYIKKQSLDSNRYLIKHQFDGNHPIQIISSGADVSEINEIENKFMEYIYRARSYIYIQTPYLILNDAMIRALKYASSKGVEIKIMIPNKNDHPIVLQATKSYAKELANDQIQIYLFDKSSFLHSKVFISDDYYLSIGTSNFDIRSFKYGLEINSFIYNKELAQFLKEIFNKQLNYCTLYDKEHINKMSTMKKLTGDLARLFSSIL